MRKAFKLLSSDSDKFYGIMTFNGKFTFTLDSNVDLEVWNKIGFIPVDESRYVESEDLFRHLNSRLPIPLRSESNEKKLAYIDESGLRVASDRFHLESVDLQSKFSLDS